MRRLALAAATVAICMTAAAATFAGGPHKGKPHGGKTLTIYAVTAPNGLAVIPVQPGKFSLGDRVALSDNLFTSKGGKRLGTDGGACVVTRVTDAATGSGVLECEVTFRLPRGDIATQALNTLDKGAFSGVQSGAITGGTGKYRNAKGELSLTFLSPDEANITFHFGR